VAVAALVVIGLGVVLIVVGVAISISDWRAKKREAQAGRMENKPLGLDENLTALKELVIALADKPLGMQLVVWGIVLLLIGGILGGVSGLTA
jgi:hypothetical protein